MDKAEKGKFLEVICPRCKNVQVVFGKGSMDVKCSKCNYLLVKTTGGKTKVKGPVKQVWK
jgi:ribosomal protein S27E